MQRMRRRSNRRAGHYSALAPFFRQAARPGEQRGSRSRVLLQAVRSGTDGRRAITSQPSTDAAWTQTSLNSNTGFCWLASWRSLMPRWLTGEQLLPGLLEYARTEPDGLATWVVLGNTCKEGVGA